MSVCGFTAGRTFCDEALESSWLIRPTAAADNNLVGVTDADEHPTASRITERDNLCRQGVDIDDVSLKLVTAVLTSADYFDEL